MQKKWRLFKIASYLQLILSFAIVPAQWFLLHHRYRNINLNVITIWTVIIITPIIIFTIICIHLIQRKYPDKYLSKLNARLFNIAFLFIFYVVS